MASIAKEHQVWINYLQPEGLVVSSMVLEDAGLALPSELREKQINYHGFLDIPPDEAGAGDDSRTIISWERFTRDFLSWPDKYVVSGEAIADGFRLFLPEYNETIAPSQVLLAKAEGKADKATEGKAEALALVQVLPVEVELDKQDLESKLWLASPKRKLERLLRETGVPVGILSNRRFITLIYAPRGENAGSLSFPVGYMATVMGRSSLGALLLLLGKSRLWTDVPDRRLEALLDQSRRAQAKVSIALAQQVMAALYELLRGFAAANALSGNRLLGQIVADSPDEVYSALLTVLMRLVFLLYAEDRGLMPGGDVYVEGYSVHGLMSKLREDNQLFPDTMDQRFGAWARLLALFRAVYEGCEHPELRLPKRRGHLFDPDRHPFLEGDDDLPPVSDGCIGRVLDKLLILRGEKLSYRTLDVEQIGSVYEAVMGFQFQVVQGLSIAIRPKKSNGAPPVIDLSALLAKKPAERKKAFKDWTDRDLNPKTLERLKSAATLDELLDALKDVQDDMATPHPLPAGGWILHPTDERRRSGSHYTPRSLTAPIVEKALEPLWLRLGAHPQPEEILDLNVCDPAMGSGAFLVEACRQIADRLIEAWRHHDCVPVIPSDEDEVLHARRIVAQRCLYGVDRNPMAVDLAKLSLWLATLAKDHPFTFLDHALRCGDSLVGLSRGQITAFHWESSQEPTFISSIMEERLKQAITIRNRILASDEASMNPEKKAEQLRRAEEELTRIRLAGDLVLAAWFGNEKDKDRLAALEGAKNRFQWALDRPEDWKALEAEARALRSGPFPVLPFHWELEFPEVFSGREAGFDCFVGNPPFMGGSKISTHQGKNYLNWLLYSHLGAHGNGDIVAHFYRKAFDLLKIHGTFGLIATNTISQGDTRQTGLAEIRRAGGIIYAALRRLKWPGEAAVVVSVVHVTKSCEKAGIIPAIFLDGKSVRNISAFLFEGVNDKSPIRLAVNKRRAFLGSKVYGQGFVFDDTDPEANSIAEMKQLIESDPRNKARIFPYLGGEEITTSPTHSSSRFVFNFAELSEEEARSWPDLFAIAERKVKPKRSENKREVRRHYWWRFGESTPALYRAIAPFERILAISNVTSYSAFCLASARQIFAHTVIVFPTSSLSFFCLLQSRVHEVWARFFASSLEDRLRYTPSDCFETFPFPPNWEQNAELEAAGTAYYDYRAALMIRTDKGLTKTYNRFHDPDETSADIVELRRLHGEMDRAVLGAYGWEDIPIEYGFFLDYEEEEAEEDLGSGRRGKKKPWRYRWPDDIRDLLLARLLELNARQAAAQGEILPSAGSDDEDLSEGDEAEDEDGED